jgi:hypothetical protein
MARPQVESDTNGGAAMKPHARKPATSKLIAAQNDLVEKLTDANCPRVVAVQAEVGTGISRPIEYLIEQFARTASVLLVVPNSAILAQHWIDRLSDVKDTFTIQKLSLSLSLDMLEQGVPASGSIIVSTAAILHQSNVQRLVDTWPGVLIVLEPTAVTQSRLAAAMSTAQRTILVTITSDQLVGKIPVVARLVRDELPSTRTVPYQFDVSPYEETLMKIAGQFTLENGPKEWADLPETRPSLLDRLLRIATAGPLSQHPTRAESSSAEIAETAWNYIDQLENFLTQDPRLTALDQAVDGCGQKAIFTVTPSSADLDYVLQHLESMHGKVTKIDSAEDAERALAQTRAGSNGPKLISGTVSVFRKVSSWPKSAAMIIWSRESHVLEELAEGIQASGNFYIASLRSRSSLDDA